MTTNEATENFMSKILFSLACGFFLNAHALNILEQVELSPKAESCDFYLLAEIKHKCAAYGAFYFSSYGYRYCMSFLSAKDSWPEPVQTWVAKTARCLQEHLFQTQINNSNPADFCPILEKEAFKSHSHCYESQGFCKLSLYQQGLVVRHITDLNLVLTARKTIPEALRLALDCSRYQLNQFPRCDLL